MTADVDALLRSVTIAFRDALHATLDDDVARAEQVLVGAPLRRGLATAARTDARSLPRVSGPQQRDRLGFIADIADIADISDTIDDLARCVVAGDDIVALTPARRMEVAVLLDAGGRRLRCLQLGPSGRDSGYGSCAAALFEVADLGEHDASTRLYHCALIASIILRASRHAACAA